MAEKLTQGEIQEWMSRTEGRYLTTKEICDGMRIDPNVGNDNLGTLYTALSRLTKAGILKHHPTTWAKYRYVDVDAAKMDLVSANPLNIVPIKLPFGIEQYVKLYKRNVVVVYGSKDSGKTALLINLMKLNLGRLPIRYINTDMGEEELVGRLLKFEDVTIEQWQEYVDFRYLGEHIPEDLIDSDSVNILDFLEVFKDFYAVGEPIKQMASKLNDGILVVALQKNPDAELPLGKGRGLEKTKLALNLDPGKVTIAVGKNWQDGVTVSPKGKSWKYKLIGGAKIVNPQEVIDG